MNVIKGATLRISMVPLGSAKGRPGMEFTTLTSPRNSMHYRNRH